MERAWSKRNVDLRLLKDNINEFLENNDFDVTINETGGGYQLLASGSTTYVMKGEVSIVIRGKPDEFTVNLELQRKRRERFLSLPMTLTAFFGFGYFLLEDFKSDETWLKFKKDFKEHADRIVTQLGGSAGSCHAEDDPNRTQESTEKT